MPGKALTTAFLLTALAAALQAQAGPALGATIVIDSARTIQVAHQGGHQRHWHKRPAHHKGIGRPKGHGRHVRHLAPRPHLGGRHPARRHATWGAYHRRNRH